MHTSAHIISFASPKGGVGKSTTCACLAGAFASRGYEVLIIDLDQNRTLQQWALRFPAQLKKIQVEAVAEKDLIERLKTLYHSFNGFVLIDVAGVLATTTIVAATIAHLTITPTKLSEPGHHRGREAQPGNPEARGTGWQADQSPGPAQ